jgi:hypothetical protein
MKKILALVLLMFSFSIVNAQVSSQINYNEKVQTLDSTVKTLYSIIDGGQGIERNWELFKFLFKDDAEIILTTLNTQDENSKFYLTVDQFINSYGKWLVKNGLQAKETERTISTFRHMNNVTSAYEYTNTDSNPAIKGVNSINLLNENNRWYISNIKWNQEMSDLKSLQEYLRVSKN